MLYFDIKAMISHVVQDTAGKTCLPQDFPALVKDRDHDCVVFHIVSVQHGMAGKSDNHIFQ